MTPLIKLSLIIRDLLPHPEDFIKRGEINEEMKTSEIDYIVVNSLSAAQPITRGESFDGEAEELTLVTGYRMPVTVDFYGTNAYTNASRLQLLLKSDKCLELQALREIGTGSVSGVADIKQLTGQQYINRFQLTLTMFYNESLTLETKRIDVVQSNIIRG